MLGLLFIHGQKVVASRGDAPRSSAYQAGALLLSYKAMADGVGIAPTQPGGSLGFRDRGITTLPTIRNGQGGGSGLPKPCQSEARDGTVANATRSAPADGRAQAPSFRGRPSAADLHPEKMAARVGFAPTLLGLTGRHATVDNTWQWRCRQELHLHRFV